MLFLEPWIGELNCNHLKSLAGYLFDQLFQPQHRVAECIPKVPQFFFDRDAVCFIYQWFANFHSEKIPSRLMFRHPQEKSTARRTEIEMKRELWIRKDLLDPYRLRRLAIV